MVRYHPLSSTEEPITVHPNYIIRDTVKDKGIQEKESEGEKESKVGLGFNDNGRQVVSQEPKLKYLHELYDDFVDNKTKAKPNGKQSKIRKYFTNLTVRDRSEVKALIFETCGGWNILVNWFRYFENSWHCYILIPCFRKIFVVMFSLIMLMRY